MWVIMRCEFFQMDAVGLVRSQFGCVQALPRPKTSNGQSMKSAVIHNFALT